LSGEGDRWRAARLIQPFGILLGDVAVRTILYFLILFLLFCQPLVRAQQKQESPPSTFVFKNVTVIDVSAQDSEHAIKLSRTVVITGGRITSVGRNVRIPAGAQVIDATGKYLIPGLWDMHVHTLREDRVETFFPLFVVNGVTGVRDMGTPLENFELFKRWREEIAEGTRLGPRIIAASPFVDGANPVYPNVSISVSNEEEARRAVRSLKQRGMDFIKVYNNLSREAFLAIADESKRQGITFAGHVPIAVSAAEASEAGQKSIEHLTGVALACSTDEDVLRREAVARTMRGAKPLTPAQADEQAKRLLATYSEKKAEALFAVFLRNGTWHVPTLSQVRSSNPDEYNLRHEELMKYVPPSMRVAPRETASAEGREISSRWAGQKLEIVGAMRRAGVRLMAGTDTSGTYPYSFPGFTLHDELVLLVRAGLTPLEALRSATLNPARFLNMQGILGTVERGKEADLVLLEADPLENISNTKKIAAVLVKGRYLPKSELQKILLGVQAAANER
jgi:imidazolonepropionase-like amidohydrolase